MHFTDEAGQAGIQGSGMLRGSQGIYAVPQATAAQSTVGRTAQTLLAPAQTTHAGTLPQAASGAFSRPIPLGPLSAYQYFTGVHRAAAGSINLSTGAFTAGSARFLPNVTGQFFTYGADALLWIAAASMSPAVEGAETRGLPGLGVPTLTYLMRDTFLSTGPQPPPEPPRTGATRMTSGPVAGTCPEAAPGGGRHTCATGSYCGCCATAAMSCVASSPSSPGGSTMNGPSRSAS